MSKRLHLDCPLINCPPGQGRLRNQSYSFAGCCSSLDCSPSFQMCFSLAVPVGGNFHLAISTLGPIAAGLDWDQCLLSCGSGWVILHEGTCSRGRAWWLWFSHAGQQVTSSEDGIWLRYKAVWLKGLGHWASSTPCLIHYFQEAISLILKYGQQMGVSHVFQKLIQVCQLSLLGSTHLGFIPLGRETAFPPCSLQQDFLSPTIFYFHGSTQYSPIFHAERYG